MDISGREVELYNLEQLYTAQEAKALKSIGLMVELAGERDPAAFATLDSAPLAINQLVEIKNRYESAQNRW